MPSSSGSGAQVNPFSENLNNEATCVESDRDKSTQALSTVADIKRSYNKSNNAMPSTDYRRKINLVEMTNVANEEEDEDSGKHVVIWHFSS